MGKHLSGVRLGLVNMDGAPLGLWNRINARETFKVIPFINAKF